MVCGFPGSAKFKELRIQLNSRPGNLSHHLQPWGGHFPWGPIYRKTAHSQVFCPAHSPSGGELCPIHALPLTGLQCPAGAGLRRADGLQPAGGCCQPECCLSGANSLQVLGAGARGGGWEWLEPRAWKTGEP